MGADRQPGGGGSGGPRGGATRGGRRRDRGSPAEARARRAAVEDPDAVLAAAARLLEARQRTVTEVRRRLTDAGYRSDLVETAVTRLVELGYLDDEEFARAWVASRDRAHPRGERALRVELARKGVAREIVDEVLAERGAAAEGVEEAADGASRRTGAAGAADTQAAGRLLERRRSSLQRVADPHDRRRRAYALLARAGFDPGTAAEAAASFVGHAAEE